MQLFLLKKIHPNYTNIFQQYWLITESYHLNDIAYVFKGFHQFNYSEADKQMSAFMVESFRNFVLTGYAQ